MAPHGLLHAVAVVAAALASLPLVHSQACTTTLSPKAGIRPTVASGYSLQVVATGLSRPRGIKFDSNGNLLVVEVGKGVSSHVLQDDGGACVRVKSSKTIVSNTGLTHGIALSNDGATLYASTVDQAFSWTYNAAQSTVGTTRTTLISGMTNTDHSTRTLLISRDGKSLIVARGSADNMDYACADKSTGHCQVKSFPVTGYPSAGYDFTRDGTVLGWGLRNEVGIAEHPSGGLWGVENSVDQLTRDGTDVHQDNPGEELNFLGYLNGTASPNQGANFGYPNCFAAWSPSALPKNTNMQVGTQFSPTSANDTACAARIAPRLTFFAHTAPLDIAFNNSGTEGWVSFHGSWNRNTPVGYNLALIPWSASGQPVDAANSNTAARSIVGNQNLASCPNSCLRPVGIAFDKKGRLFFSSDSSGEIYVVVRTSATTGTLDSTLRGTDY